MADFRLRIGFAKTGAAVWLSHLEIVRALERCIRRSGLPYAISQGFSPHLKHSFSAALPVGTGSTGEYMDVDIESLIPPEQALCALQAVQTKDLPILSAEYAPKDEPSLQVYFNLASYCIVLDDANGATVSELLKRLAERPEIEVIKKKKPKVYDLTLYVEQAWADDSDPHTLYVSLFSRPEGSLRPEVSLQALTEPERKPRILELTRTALEHREL